LIGPSVRVGRDRGRPLESDLAELVTITVHPSSILRAQDDGEREAAFDDFVADLSEVASWLGLGQNGRH
jgi:DNA polymerase